LVEAWLVEGNSMRDEPRKLTDRFLKSLKPAKSADRDDYPDKVAPGFLARVTDKGKVTFNLLARYPGSTNPTRRALGEYPAMRLEDAREKAQEWRKLIKRGIDPAIAEERARQAHLRNQAMTFAAVAEDFIRGKLPTERKGREIERDIRREFMPRWGHLPISDISDLDAIAVINAKKKQAPAQARNLLGTANRFFAWAKDQRIYGPLANPCADLRPSKLIGDKATRDRILSDDEVFAFWRNAKRMGYPYAPIYQLLMLTALRLNEVADASWSEFDLRNRVWVIPAARMKGKNTKARAHAVPLTDELLSIVKELPRFNAGDYMFSTKSGEKPVWVGDKVKKRLDARMQRTLRALAKIRDDDPAKAELAPWTNHDIRRSVRSQLSRLKISEEAREAVLAHVRPGIKGTYDWHDYLDEKREALSLWAAKLKSIIEPPENNVVTLRA
jgi:integrase